MEQQEIIRPKMMSERRRSSGFLQSFTLFRKKIRILIIFRLCSQTERLKFPETTLRNTKEITFKLAYGKKRKQETSVETPSRHSGLIICISLLLFSQIPIKCHRSVLKKKNA